MIKPKKAGPGCGVGVFSSSSPVSYTAPARYSRGRRYLETKGFRVIDGALYGRQDHYRSGSIAQRAAEFNALLHNDDVHILMAAIGGMNTNSILPYLDYDYLKTHPKILIGYSDVTALLLAVYAKTGLVTFYGPALAASFGELPPYVDTTYGSFASLVCGQSPAPQDYPKPPVWTEEYLSWENQSRAKAPRPNAWVTVRPGVCEGRLIGGNLNTMQGIFGTEYMPEIRPGDILLLEDSLKDAATVERSFSLLKLAGVLDRIGGLILGKHEQFDDCGTGRRPYEILQEVAGEGAFPILAQFDCCHTHPMLTVPIGCRVRLDAGAQRVTLLESPVEG